MLAHCLHQHIIDADRNVIACEGILQARSIITLPGIKDIGSHLRCQSRSNGIALFQECAMQAFKRIFAHSAVRTTNENQVVAFCQFYLFTCLIFNNRKLQVRIVYHREDAARSFCHLPGCRENSFNFC